MAQSDKEWERIGRTEPFYGVWTDEQFLNSARDEQAEKRFWQSGDAHVRGVFEVVRTHLEPEFEPEVALDYGCGVGRLLLPLAARCGSVTGVDVSAAMLEIAGNQLTTRSVTNVSLVRGGDGTFPGPDTFNFVHSFIVFQHIPVKRGYAILDQLLDRLATGGIGVLHFSYRNIRRNRWLRSFHRMPLGRELGNILKGRPTRQPQMLMEEYDLNKVMQKIQSASSGLVHVRPTDHGVLGVVFYFKRA